MGTNERKADGKSSVSHIPKQQKKLGEWNQDQRILCKDDKFPLFLNM